MEHTATVMRSAHLQARLWKRHPVAVAETRIEFRNRIFSMTLTLKSARPCQAYVALDLEASSEAPCGESHVNISQHGGGHEQGRTCKSEASAGEGYTGETVGRLLLSLTTNKKQLR